MKLLFQHNDKKQFVTFGTKVKCVIRPHVAYHYAATYLSFF